MSKKRWKMLMIIGLLLVAVVLIGVQVQIIRYQHPALGFAYYEPTYLPPTVSIKARRISMFKDVAWAELNFRTEDWVDGVQEGSSAKYGSIGTANQDYSASSVLPTCGMFTSPKGQIFRLCHWIDYGRTNIYEVKFNKGGTYIESRIPTDLQTQTSVDDISSYVDSFVQKSSWSLPVLRTNGV